MKKSIVYILFALFSFSAAVSLTACKDDGVEISGAYKSKTPKNVKLLEYGATSLTICWDFIYGATSYTVQLVDSDMNPVSEALCQTTADIDYHEFTDLATDRIYYGRVRANYPYSATSDWVYVSAHDKPAMLMAAVGILDLDPQLRLHAATGSTLTFEWSYTDDMATDAARSYNVELFRDEACSDLFVSWLADGKLSSDKGIFTGLANYPVVRFTFSGLDPETTYYARVSNLSFGNIQTPVVAGTTAAAGPEATAGNPAKPGEIVLAQDFSNFIHGGDIVNSAAGYNAVSGSEFRKTWEKATGENPQADGDRPVCNWATEFHIHTGGTSAEYVERLGMTGWGSSGNTSTRPGYIKCGGGSGGIGILYTPELTNLPGTAAVTVSFSASAYAEGESVYGSDVIVEAVEGAEFGANNVVSKKGTAFASKVVDISSAVGEFKTYTVTLEGLTPGSRIAFSSNPGQASANKTRFLLDDIVITYDGETPREQLATPANVKVDTGSIQSDKLTFGWDAVTGAASYTAAYWADGTDEAEAELVEGIGLTTCTLEKLIPETRYNVKVKAIAGRLAIDSDWSATVSATTAEATQGKLDTPANLSSERGFSTVGLKWDAVSGATGYKVSYDNTSQTVTDNACTVSGLTAGRSYTFSVVALAALEADNSDAATLQASTLYVKVVAATTSSIILEWEQAGTATEYTVSITDPSTSASQSYTYDWSATKGWGDPRMAVPLRFAFHQVSDDFAAGGLKAGTNYQLKVKTGTETAEAAWSLPVEGSVRAHNAVTGEIFYEDFDNMPGSDAVMLASGVKSTAKVESLSDMFRSLKAYGWYDGVGAMNLAGNSFSADVQRAMFRLPGWEIGSLGSSITHNAYNGCFRLGGDNKNQSYIMTPAMSGLSQATDVTVSFKTAVHVFWQTGTPGAPAVSFNGNWRRDQFESMELYVVHEDGTKEKVGGTIPVGTEGSELAWKSHSITVSGLLPTDKLMFTSVDSTKSRYYIDEISVVKH